MILITRPTESSKKLQIRFRKIGIQSIIESLTKIQISKRNIQIKDNLYLIASQHAVEFLKNKKIRDKIRETEFIVIGHATAQKLLNLGAEKIINVVEDSNELFKILKKIKPKKNITYLCGSNRNQSFVNKLKQLHGDVLVKQIYKVISLNSLSQNLVANLTTKKIDAVLFFSLKNAKLFLKLCKMNGNVKYMNLTYVCISRRIADFMIKNSCKNATYSSKLNEEMVIKKTQDLLKI